MSTNAEPPSLSPRPAPFFQREILAHPILYTVLAVQLVFLAWLLATPTAFRKPPVTAHAPVAPAAMKVEVTDDAAIGGGLVAPMSAPAEPGGKAAKPGKADDGKQGGRIAVPAGSDLVVHLAFGGAAGDALVGASSPAVATVALASEAGAPADEIPVADGAAEILLGGLADAIDKGGSVPVTLTFAQAGDVELDVPVWRNRGAAEANPGAPVAAGDVTIDQAWAEPAG